MKNIIDILKIHDEFFQKVTEEMDGILAETEAREARELLVYAVSQKGQMIRPGMVYLTAAAVNPDLTEAEMKKLILYAAAIELLHTASLVHDDILDCAEERRGRKSVYKAFGSGSALLTGNVFYLNAFDTVNRYLDKAQIGSMLLAATDMCCGEILQLSNQGKTMTTDVYIDIIRKKTASLIKYACKESARIAGMPEEIITDMQNLGEYLGILYQLMDDYKDRDVLLESSFDFRSQIGLYTGKAREVISKLPESVYKEAFQEFADFFRLAAEA